MPKHTEAAFEAAIEARLIARGGYTALAPAAYDEARAPEHFRRNLDHRKYSNLLILLKNHVRE